MMYILSEEEYAKLQAEKKHKFNLTTKQLQILCSKICNEMPVKWGWDGVDDPKPWGCILTPQEENEEWYCDECPVQDICPSPEKTYSQ